MKRAATIESHAAMQTNHTVMIIEDNSRVRAKYRNVLETAGISVVEASNGAEGLIWLLGETADVIILDAEAPVVDGWSFLEYRLRHGKIRDIPVVVVTSQADDAGPSHILLRLGAERLLHQPLIRENFLRTVQGLLAKPRNTAVPPSEEVWTGARKGLRLTFNLPIRIGACSSGEISGMLRDLSPGGLGAYLPCRLLEWEPITIHLAGEWHSLTLTGYVQWFSKNRSIMSYHYGIQFTERQHDSFPLRAYAFFRQCSGASRFHQWPRLRELGRRVFSPMVGNGMPKVSSETPTSMRSGGYNQRKENDHGMARK